MQSSALVLTTEAMEEKTTLAKDRGAHPPKLALRGAPDDLTPQDAKSPR